MLALGIGFAVRGAGDPERQLGAEDRREAVVARGEREAHHAVEAVVVGDGQAGEPEARRFDRQLLGMAGAVEEGEVGVAVELGVRHGDRDRTERVFVSASVTCVTSPTNSVTRARTPVDVWGAPAPGADRDLPAGCHLGPGFFAPAAKPRLREPIYDRAMLLSGINHVAVLTQDTDRFHAFYRDVFDADRVRRPGDQRRRGRGAEEGRLSFVTIGPHTQLNVFELPGNPEAAHHTPMFGRGPIDHMGLQAESQEAFDEIRRRLIERGCTDGFVTDFGVAISLFFIDPDGLEGEVRARQAGHRARRPQAAGHARRRATNGSPAPTRSVSVAQRRLLLPDDARARHRQRSRDRDLVRRASGDTLYLLAGAGERSDWVRNLQVEPRRGCASAT